jgi:hypothetical protein
LIYPRLVTGYRLEDADDALANMASRRDMPSVLDMRERSGDEIPD